MHTAPFPTSLLNVGWTLEVLTSLSVGLHTTTNVASVISTAAVMAMLVTAMGTVTATTVTTMEDMAPTADMATAVPAMGMVTAMTEITLEDMATTLAIENPISTFRRRA